MDVKAEFKNGGCKLYLMPEDDWEKKLLAAVAKGGESLSAVVTYKQKSSYDYGRYEETDVVEILLEAGNV